MSSRGRGRGRGWCHCIKFPNGHRVKAEDVAQHSLDLNELQRSNSHSLDAIATVMTALTLSDSKMSTDDSAFPLVPNPLPLQEAVNSIEILADQAASTDYCNHSDYESESELSELPDLTSGGQGGYTKKALDLMHVLQAQAEDVGRKIHDETQHSSMGNKELHLYLLSISSQLSSIEKSAARVTNTSSEVLQLKSNVLSILERVEQQVTCLGADLESDVTKPVLYNSNHVFPGAVVRLDTICQIVILIGMICYTILGISTTGCNFIIETVVVLLKLAMKTGIRRHREDNGSFDGDQRNILDHLPKNVNDAIQHLGIAARTTVHARCPKCNFVVSPTKNITSAFPTYPEQCPNEVPGKTHRVRCNAYLLQERHGRKRPLLPYMTASIIDHLARELANSEFEGYMDRACDRLAAVQAGRASADNSPSPQSTTSPTTSLYGIENLAHAQSPVSHTNIIQSNNKEAAALPSLMHDPFDGSFLRQFKGHDGRFFCDRQQDPQSLRVMYAIHVDFFTPHGITKRGPKHSIGIISLANLSLPEDIRYKPEHLHICGVIPGPNEPEKADISYYLRPIMDEVLIGYEQGYFVTKTAKYENGRLVHYAIVISINDLPGARKVSGNASQNSHFYCTVCNQQEVSTLYDTNFESWTFPNINELREQAFKWRDAETEQEREQIFHDYGIRWSEFWRYRCWDPSRMLIVDPMHNSYEGLGHYMCRHVLALDDTILKEGNTFTPCYTYPWTQYHRDVVPANYHLNNEVTEAEQIPSIHKWLTKPLGIEDTDLTEKLLEEKLAKTHNLSPLRFVCYSLGITLQIETHTGAFVAPKSKAHFAKLLVQWRLSKPLTSSKTLPPSASFSTLAHVQHVITHTTTPSWISSVPKNFGTATAGTIKADEWRTLCTIYVPIALIVLWGESNSSPSTHQPILDHSMALFQALTILSRYTTSVERAEAYRTHLKYWVENLYLVHPHTRQHKKRPNVHAAFHIYDFLLLYGPVRSWWAFPFERLIGTIQRIKTNDLIGGPLEKTMLTSWANGANLRQWLCRPDCPPVVQHIKMLLDKAFSHGLSAEDSKDQQLKDGEHAYYRAGKHVFSRASTHLGNSIILYYPSQSANDVVAGSIQKIETVKSVDFFIVRRYADLPKGQYDPFLRYPDFPARTYSSKFVEGVLDKIFPSQVLSHGAKFEFSNERAIILNLSRD